MRLCYNYFFIEWALGGSMLLCLDVGNSHIFGGLFNEDASVKVSFRITSKAHTSDEFAIFLLHH